MRNSQKLLWVTVAVATLAAGCVVAAGTAGASSGGAKETLTIGVLTDESGLGASGNQTTPLGVKAGTLLAAKEGYHIKYVVADTATSPTGALTAAQKLVEEDTCLGRRGQLGGVLRCGPLPGGQPHTGRRRGRGRR